MNDQDVVDAVRSSGLDPTAASRAAMRSTLEGAMRGEQLATVIPVEVGRRTSRPGRWWAGGLVATAAIAAIVLVTTNHETKHVAPSTVPDTVVEPDDSNPVVVPPSSIPPATVLAQLVGHRWIIVATISADGERPWPSPVLPYVEFGTSGVILKGNDGCNTYSGQGSLQGDTLQIATGGSTSVSCPEVTEDGALHDGDHLVLSADGTTLDVQRPDGGTHLTLVQAESFLPAVELDGLFAVAADSQLPIDFVRSDIPTSAGDCLSAWTYANGQLVVDSASLQTQLQGDCLRNKILDRADRSLLDELSFTSPLSVVQNVDATSVILLGSASPIRLTPTSRPLSTVGITIDRASVLGLTTGQDQGPDKVLATLEPQLGPVDHDTGWYTTPVVTYADGTGDCLGGKEFRVLWWGDLSLAFWRLDRQVQLWSWSVGDRQTSTWGDRREPYTPANPTPTGLPTEEGIHVGDDATTMLTAYGNRLFGPSDPALPDGTLQYFLQGPDETYLQHRGVGVAIDVRDGVVTGIGSALQFC